jgi:hypothetical protein
MWLLGVAFLTYNDDGGMNKTLLETGQGLADSGS